MPDPTPQHPVAVDARGINKSFGDGSSRLHVLKDVDLTVRKGEIMMLVGPSGCGKTTLLSIIGGTLRADEGEVHAFGHSLHRLRSGPLTRFRARHVGFIFQQFNLIPTISAAENVAIPLLTVRVPPVPAVML